MDGSSERGAAVQTLRTLLLEAHAANEISLAQDLLDDEDIETAELLLEVDRVLAELLANKRKYHLFQHRFSEILDFACGLANLEFGSKLELRGEYDEMDAVCLALNMLGEELQSSTLSHDQVRAIFDAIPDSIIVMDPDGGIQLANTATGNLLECHPASLNGRPVSEVLELPEQTVAEVLTSTRTQPVRDRGVTYLASRRQGGIPVSLAAAPIQGNQGQIDGYVWIAKDITHRKALERALEVARDDALESSRLKSEFLANMSHEIRTPMNGVMGMLELLLDTRLSRNQEEMARTAMDSAHILLQVLNDILDFSKIEAGKLVFENVDFELQNLLDETIQLLAVRAHEKKLALTGLVLCGRPVVVKGDPGRLRQVLINLISNAIKFTSEGEVAVRVHIEEPTATDIVEVRIEVQDTGIGIPFERQGRIFGAFVQGDGSTTRVHGGTGLGLAICRQIVALMGGEIGLRSEPGIGSTFWFTARFARAATSAVESTPSHETLAGTRLLIASKPDRHSDILEYYLDGWGVHWQSVADGQQALLKLRRAARAGRPFELVLVDMELPTIPGATLANFISLDPEIPTPHLAILIAVGHAGIRDAESLGIAAQLTKPIRKHSLLRELTRLRESRQHSSPEAPGAQSDLPFDHPRILVAEDNPINARVAKRQLSKLGCEVDVAPDGLQAIAALERNSYALVFMDCQMPRMDGYEATRRIRAIDGARARVPIVAMTANAFEGERQKCLDAGMDDYLTKPFTRDTLITTMTRWLGPSVPGHSSP